MMRSLLPTLVLSSLLAGCGGPAAAPTNPTPGNTGGSDVPAEDPAPRAIASWDQETFGALGLELPEAEVVAALGEPDVRPPYEEMAATGEVVAQWTWASKGVAIEMREAGGGKPAVVNTLTLTAPASYRSGHGRVGIGSTFDEVFAAYADLPVGEEDDPRDPSSRDELTIGSIYGGLMFTFENERVTHIFMGAGAE